jgi:hypothetical protein
MSDAYEPALRELLDAASGSERPLGPLATIAVARTVLGSPSVREPSERFRAAAAWLLGEAQRADAPRPIGPCGESGASEVRAGGENVER